MPPDPRVLRRWRDIAGRPGMTAGLLLESMADEGVEHLFEHVRDALPRPAVPQPHGRPPRQPAGPARPGPAPVQPAADLPPATSPYRFVELNDVVLPAPAPVRSAALNTPLPGGISGTIAVTWEAETPLLIGQATGREVEPLRLGPAGPFVIPGATLKGLLRAAIEIVTLGRLTQLNADHRFGGRDFNDPHYRDAPDGTSRLAWDKLRAGWLSHVPATDAERAQGLSDYLLTPCRKHTVRIRDLPPTWFGGEPDPGTRHLAWLRRTLVQKYQPAGLVVAGQPSFAHPPPAFFAPGTGTDVVPASSGLVGTYVFSGPLPLPTDMTAADLDAEEAEPRAGNKKKREYVFVDDPAETPIRVPQAVFDAFHLIHSAPSGRGWNPVGSWALLRPVLEPGGCIPVFTLGEVASGRFDIGLTRSFKTAHRATVGEVLARTGNGVHRADPAQPDWAEALFGHVLEEDDLPPAAPLPHGAARAPADLARRGRVSVGFASTTTAATLFPPCGQPAICTTMMGPRASFAPHYVAGPEKHWSAPDARLAGRKRYFPRFDPNGGAAASDVIRRDHTLPPRGGEGTVSRLRFLVPSGPAPLRFTGSIRLHNLLPEEVGALLWVLTHGGDTALRHMVGRAKAFGAGQLRVVSVALGGLAGHDAGAADTLARGEAGFLSAFGAAMDAAVKDAAVKAAGRPGRWADQPQVREWLLLSNPAWGAAERAAGLARYPGAAPGSEDGMNMSAGPKQHKALRDKTAPRGGAGRDRWLLPRRPPS